MAFAGSLSWLRRVQSVSILIVVIPAVDVAQNLVGGCQLSEGLVGLVHVVRILQKKVTVHSTVKVAFAMLTMSGCIFLDWFINASLMSLCLALGVTPSTS
jgi:hypothetical protein